ncbi:hypothetical protein OH705_26825, partial [Pseudomonas sp. BJa3]|nr:hypothetical protein [Pseudomonas sp. BJa3]
HKKLKTRSSKAVKNQQSLENDQNVETLEPLEEKSTASSIHKAKTKKADKATHDKAEKTPTDSKRSTRRTYKKSTSVEDTSVQKNVSEESVEQTPSKIEEKADYSVVISSTPNDVPKTRRIGWWKRRTLSKN